MKAGKWGGRMLQGLGVAGIGAVYGAGGLIAAASAPMLLTGVAIGFIGLAYTGISAIVKLNTESKNKYELDNEGEDLIREFSKKVGGELSVSKSDLEMWQYVKYESSKQEDNKKEFVSDVVNKVKARLKNS